VGDAVRDRAISSRYYQVAGSGGGAFGAYDIATSTKWRIGLEVCGTAGDRNAAATVDILVFEQRPRFGIRGTVRAGYHWSGHTALTH